MTTRHNATRHNAKRHDAHHVDHRDNPKIGDDTSNRDKNPDDWTTGDEPMTGAQASYLKTLSEEAGESVDGDLTKAEASKRIDTLQEKTGRGK